MTRIEKIEKGANFTYEIISREGYNLTWESEEKNWSVELGFEQVSLLPDDGRKHAFIGHEGVYKLDYLDDLPKGALEHEFFEIKREYPDLAVHNFALIIPEDALVEDKKGNKGAPFSLYLESPSHGSAVIVSMMGLNPLTYASAVGEMDYEIINVNGEEIILQNWIPLERGGKFRLDGFPINPAFMHEDEALVRQFVLTTDKQLGVAGRFLNGRRTKRAISCIFFERKIVVFNDELKGCEPIPAETNLSSGNRDSEFVVAAGGMFPGSIPREEYDPNYYHPEPRVLLRFYPVTEAGLKKLREEILTHNGVFRGRNLPIFG